MEDKNKKQSAQRDESMRDGIVVKDLDGSFKVLVGGELKELDAVLASSEVSADDNAPVALERSLTVPRFTDLATVALETHFVEPEKSPVASPREKKDFHFHPEDKDELESEIAKISTVFDLSPQKKYSIDLIAKKIADKHGLTLSGDSFELFKKILLAYFRQMRSLTETRARLIAARTDGGMSVANDIADHLLGIVRHLKVKIEEIDGVVVEGFVAESVPPAPAQAAPLVSEQPVVEAKPTPVPKPEGEPQPLPVVKEVDATQRQDVMPAIDTVRTSIAAETTEKMPEKVINMETVVTPAPAPMVPVSPPPDRPPITAVFEETPAIPRVVRPASAPSMMHDVKVAAKPKLPQKLMGRIDELSAMDIETWRMLDANPRIRAGKILGKIQYLETESYTRRSQGIDAWRGSVVHREYLMLGQKSLERGVDVRTVISEFVAQGRDTLIIEEFEAITDLNRMLRH